MKPGIKTSIHNRFDIYKTNIETGETKQIAFAENIVLDQMWSRLANRAAYFVNIHYGTGTGTPTASRTSLFTHLGTKAAVDDLLTKTVPTASWRRKIVLNPEENVGAVITEIGVAYDSGTGSLVTHAMLMDMNGNPISITKTALDVLTIYATIFITFSVSDENIQICGLPNNNPLMNYLVGQAGIGSCYFYMGESKYPLGSWNQGIVIGSLGNSAAISWTADVANKKMTTSTPRLGINDSNGNIKEIVFGTSALSPIFRMLLPAQTVYTGLSLTAVPIGTGDGVATTFALPSKNIRSTGLKVYLDGVETSGFIRKTSSKMATFRLAEGWQRCYYRGRGACGLSRSGNVLGVAEGIDYYTPYVYTYDFQNGGFCNRATTQLGSFVRGIAFSNDGLVMAISTSGSPYVTTFDWTNGAWVQRPNPEVLPTDDGKGVSLSNDGLVLAVAHSNAPYVTTYDWTNGAWIKRADPVNLPAGEGRSVYLSNNGLFLAVAHAGSPYVTTYDWTDGAWVKRVNPVNLPTGDGTFCTLSGNELVMAIGHSNSPYITTYDLVDGLWVKRANPAITPVGAVTGAAFNNDGTLMITIYNTYGPTTSPLQIYDWDSGAWVQRALTIPSQTWRRGVQCCLTNDGLFAIGNTYNDGDNYIATIIFDLNPPLAESIIFDAPPASGVVITADYTVDGIHKTAQRVIDLNATFTFGIPG